MAMRSVKDHVSPVIAAGWKNQSTVIYFNGGFDTESIRHLINDIELVRQTPGYSSIDLYFTSNGGYNRDLNVIVDYLNNIEDIKINFIATGWVASCGFYILAMIDNENVKIQVQDSAMGVIHLADISISSRDLLGDDQTTGNYLIRHIEETNKELTEIVTHMGFPQAAVDRILSGQDLHLTAGEIRAALNYYFDWRFYNSREFDQKIDYIEEKIQHWTNMKRKWKKAYRDFTGKQYKKVVEQKPQLPEVTEESNPEENTEE